MTDAEVSESVPPALRPRADLRDARRATLLIRAAKLICRSGEYVVLVRDVSSAGVRLRLFHPLPPDTRFVLEIANGETYAMDRKWCHGDQAGFQFVEPIEVNAFIEEPGDYRRRSIRLRLQCQGQLFSEGRAVPMVLRDLSQGGARIETATWLALHQTVRLVVGGLPERFARVRWRSRYEHGLAFEQAFRLDELAAYARALQPFAVQPAPAAEDISGGMVAKAG